MEITTPIENVYNNSSVPQYEWKMYQRGFLGILNNAYNQSCNNGNGGVLGQMNEIETEFARQDVPKSWQEFVRFYVREHNGHQRVSNAVTAMVNNLRKRTASIGGSIDETEARYWSRKYIWSMISNSYTGFCSERMVIKTIAKKLDKTCETFGNESEGIDGYIGSTSVQVKPESYASIDINDSESDVMVTYRVYDGKFEFSFEDELFALSEVKSK